MGIKVKQHILQSILFAFVLATLGCSDDSLVRSPLDTITGRILLAPETISLNGQNLSLGYGYSIVAVGEPLTAFASLGSVQDSPPVHPWVEAADVWVLAGSRLFTTSAPSQGGTLEFERDGESFRLTDYVQPTSIRYTPGLRVLVAVGVRDENDQVHIIRSQFFDLIDPDDLPN